MFWRALIPERGANPRRQYMLGSRKLRAVGGVTFALAVLGTVAATAGMSAGNATTIRIWVDKDRQDAITKVANDWAGSKGVTLDIVQKGSDNIRADVKTVQAETAPD